MHRLSSAVAGQSWRTGAIAVRHEKHAKGVRALEWLANRRNCVGVVRRCRNGPPSRPRRAARASASRRPAAWIDNPPRWSRRGWSTACWASTRAETRSRPNPDVPLTTPHDWAITLYPMAYSKELTVPAQTMNAAMVWKFHAPLTTGERYPSRFLRHEGRPERRSNSDDTEMM